MKMNSSIDWLRATFKQKETPYVLSELGVQRTGEVANTFRGYDKGEKLFPAGTLQTSERQQQGNLIQFSGGELDTMMEAGHDPVGMLALLSKWKMTRVDLALDFFHLPEPASNYINAAVDVIEKAGLSGRSKSYTVIKSNSDGIEGITLYIGSRTSERFLRIYDKEIERQSSTNGHWLRIEIELKGVRANVLPDVQALGTAITTKSHIEDMVELPQPLKVLMADIETSELTKPKRTYGKSNRFAERVILPYLTLRSGEIQSDTLRNLQRVIDAELERRGEAKF